MVTEWSFGAADCNAAAAIRRSFADVLRAHGEPDSDFRAAEVVVGEMLGNAVRHAPAGEVDVILHWGTGEPTVTVRDEGGGFTLRPSLPRDTMSECGRGLFLISRLARRVSARRLAHGFEISTVLPVRRRLETLGKLA